MTQAPITFIVTASIVDSAGHYDFLNHVKEQSPELAARWLSEIRAASGTTQHINQPPRTSYSPGDGEDFHGHLCIVTNNINELHACLNAMDKACIHSPHLYVTTQGHPSEHTAHLQASIHTHGTHLIISPPQDTPVLAGLLAAKKILTDEIERFAGHRTH